MRVEVIGMKILGFIGLGVMGLPMAANLRKAGFELVVYNRTWDKTDFLVKMGAEAVHSPAEVARAADTVITMLSNDQAIRDVYLGPEGILAGVRPGVTAIDCSTASPGISRMLAQELATRFSDFLDAPVTGSKPAAEAGTLTIMVGGNEDVFLANQDVFQAMGQKIVYMGPSGYGSQTKLAHNAMVAIHSAAMAEGLAMAVKSGLNPEKFLDIVKNGSAASKQVELKQDKILDRDFSVQFALNLMLKDLNLAADFATSLAIPLPLMQNARSIFQMAANKGLGEADMSAIIQCYEEWIGHKIRRFTVSGENSAATVQDPDRRKHIRVPMGLDIKISVHQWQQEGSFSGQFIDGKLHDISETGLLISSASPLAQDMFVIVHLQKEADLPPVIAKIIRVESQHDGTFRYGCMLSGVPPYVMHRLEQYINRHAEK
ncbi:MAG TPA: NAD(P)-binding domain-containing protein [Bacilli bacterium]